MTTSYSSATKVEDLPPRVRTAILESSPTEKTKLDEWIHRPIPALQNRSVVALLAADGDEGELEIVAMCKSIKARF